MTVANYSEKDVHVYRIASERRAEVREAYDNAEWLWLVKIWNEYQVTHPKLCSSCPDSMKIVKAFTPLLWQEST